MRKILTAATAALTLAGSLAATTTTVQAQSRHGGGFRGGGGFHGGFRGGGFRGGGFHSGWRGGGWRGGRWRGGGWGWGVGAGLAGFALGSALASDWGPYYDYDYDYYGDGCASRVWDPYWGRWVIRYYC